MRHLKNDVRQENGVLSLKCGKQQPMYNNNVMFAYVHQETNILLSVLSIFFFLFYDFNLNTHGFVYVENVKYHLGLHRNVQVFAKYSVCISNIQLFYMQTCPITKICLFKYIEIFFTKK